MVPQLSQGDTLKLDLSLYQKKVNNFFKNPNNASLKRLFIYDSKGWQSLQVYEHNSEKHIGLMDSETLKTSTEATTLIQEVGYLKNLENLIISRLNLTHLPKSINQLKQLNALNISFNPIDWEETIPKLKTLPSLRHLKAYGTNLNRDQFSQLSQEIEGLEVRYTLVHYMEDNNIQNYSDDE